MHVEQVAHLQGAERLMTYRELIYYLIEMNTDDLDSEASVSIVGLPFGTYTLIDVRDQDNDAPIRLVASRKEKSDKA